MTSPADGAVALRTLRALCIALLVSPLIIGVALFITLKAKPHTGSTPSWM